MIAVRVDLASRRDAPAANPDLILEDLVKRLTAVLAATAIGAGLLSGCGGDDGGGGGGSADDYCDVLRDTKADFDDFSTSDFSNFDEFIDRVEEFADDAPDEVRADWKVVSETLTQFVDALEDAGLKPEDLEGLATGEVPDGVDVEALTEALSDMESLSSDEFEKATDNIEKHAKDECDVDLGSTA